VTSATRFSAAYKPAARNSTIRFGLPTCKDMSALTISSRRRKSVRDLAFILRALALPKVALYGESYGTFFAQAFAANYPEMVDSLVLDSAYPLDQDIFDAPAREEITIRVRCRLFAQCCL